MQLPTEKVTPVFLELLKIFLTKLLTEINSFPMILRYPERISNNWSKDQF